MKCEEELWEQRDVPFFEHGWYVTSVALGDRCGVSDGGVVLWGVAGCLPEKHLGKFRASLGTS